MCNYFTHRGGAEVSAKNYLLVCAFSARPKLTENEFVCVSMEDVLLLDNQLN